MAIYLLMALAAIHGSAAGGMLVAVVFDPLMAVLTRNRSAAVDRGLELLDREVESTPTPTFGVTLNAFFHRIGPGKMNTWHRQKKAAPKEAGPEKNPKHQIRSHRPDRLSVLLDA